MNYPDIPVDVYLKALRRSLGPISTPTTFVLSFVPDPHDVWLLATRPKSKLYM